MERKGSSLRPVIVFLSILVLCIVLVIGFLFFRHLLPEQDVSDGGTTNDTVVEDTGVRGEFTKLQATYSGGVYDGDDFDPEQLRVVGLMDDTVVEEITSFDYEAKDDYSGAYLIYTSYGTTEVVPDHIPVTSIAVEEGEYAAGSSFRGNIVLTYEDGEVREISASKVDFTEETVLVQGTNELTFIYEGSTYTVTVEAGESTAVSSALETYKEELQSSLYNVTEDEIFMTVNYYEGEDSYYLTHIVLEDPSLLHVGTAAGSYGSYTSMSQAASEFDWILGIGGSSITRRTGNSRKGSIIRGGSIIINDTSTGDEICLYEDGTLSAAEAGLTSRELRRSGVTDTVLSEDSSLIVDDLISDSADYETKPLSAVGMVSPGEYYILTSDEDGISAYSAANVLAARGCTYAGLTGTEDATGLYYHTTPIYGGSTESLQDFLYIGRQEESSESGESAE